jgi:hypothetical protein
MGGRSAGMGGGGKGMRGIGKVDVSRGKKLLFSRL